MKQLLLNTKVSKIYIISVILITLLLLASYYSYAMFTVSKERNNAISIVTGTLSYDLKVDGVSTDKLVVGPNTSKTFTIALTNPNNRIARFNFYYLDNLPSGVFAGYKVLDDYNTPPVDTGVNLEKVSTICSSQTYQIIVANHSDEEQIITLGVNVGLDYNDLTLPDNGHLFREISSTVADSLLFDATNNINIEDSDQYFVTGSTPSNYIWYSGKLWRAVSIDTADNSVKLVTQWNISAISYNAENISSFEGSYMEDWLNDTTVDGFLGNLREPEKFIKMDSKWNASETTETTKPPETTMVTDPVGLLNIYEYAMSYSGAGASNGYLNNGLYWWTLTPYSFSNVQDVYNDGLISNGASIIANGVRPSVNLKSEIKIVDGDGTENNPYRLEGDNDTNLSGTLLNTRYSGEYIRFGTGENNLYRIVSHETAGLTKITSVVPLKESDNYITSAFGNNVIFSSTNTIGTLLNENYLNSNSSYLSSNDIAMIEANTIWYLGTVDNGVSYKLAKYVDDTDDILTLNITTADVGLLRYGELMAGQFDVFENVPLYLLLSPYNSTDIRNVSHYGSSYYDKSDVAYGVKPALNLKSDIIITSGTGTKDDPFALTLDS